MKDIDRDIIRGLADNNLNVTHTAKAIYMSRRNLFRRIERIEKQTGLNPRKFWDLIELMKMCGVM